MLLKSRPKLQYTAADGTWIPGTTTVLNVLAKDALVPWAHRLGLEGRDYIAERDQSAEVGTIVHYLIECDLNDKPSRIDVAFGQANVDKAASIFDGFLDWKIDYPFHAEQTEIPLSNDRYGGTLDIIGQKAEQPFRIFDVKTSGGVYFSHLIQLAAYRRLYREIHGLELEATIIHLPRHGGCRTIDFNKSELDVAETAFAHCLHIYNQRKQLEEIMQTKKKKYAKKH